MGDRASYDSGAPSIYNIEALEETELVLISRQSFEALCPKIPAFNELVKTLLHRSFIAAQARAYMQLSPSAQKINSDDFLNGIRRSSRAYRRR